MALLDLIKANQLAARKARDAEAASILTTLIGEAETIGKNANRRVKDIEVVSLIKKFIDNIDFTLSKVTEGREKYLVEKELLSTFLPVQLSRDRLTQIISDIKTEVNASSPKDMGKIMSVLKARHEGHYDGKMAAEIMKAKLAG